MVGKVGVIDDEAEHALDFASGVEGLLRPAEQVERLRLEDLVEADRHRDVVFVA